MSVALWVMVGSVLASSAVSVATLGYVMLIQPLLAAPAHGLRGLKRARARSATEGFAALEPPMRWLAARISPLSQRERDARLAQEITIAGELWGMWPAELRALGLMGCVTGAILGLPLFLLFDVRVAPVMLAGVGLIVPGMQITRLGKKRVNLIARRLPHIVDLLVLSLGAGLDFPAALRQVVEQSADPQSDMIEELGLVLEALKLGSTRRKALEDLAQRVPCDEVRDLVSAVVQSEEQGTPLAAVLETQATTSRQRRSARAEEVAARAATTMALPLSLVFVSVIILIAGPLVLTTMASTTGLGGAFQ